MLFTSLLNVFFHTMGSCFISILGYDMVSAATLHTFFMSFFHFTVFFYTFLDTFKNTDNPKIDMVLLHDCRRLMNATHSITEHEIACCSPLVCTGNLYIGC